jgi:ribosomal-protein-alanine N-acetyltransferase
MPRTVAPAVAPGTMSSVRQPTIAVDAELTLRPFRFDDTDRVIEAFDDPDIRRWHARRLDSVLQARQWIGYCHLLWLQEKCANFAVVDTTDRVLGRVAMYTELVGGTGEIGYWVLPDAQGCGVASRAGSALTLWAHETLGLHRILLEHAVGNVASCGVARSLRYELEGTARSLHLLADGRHDVHLHAHLHADPSTDLHASAGAD